MAKNKKDGKELIVPVITKKDLTIRVEKYVREDNLTYVESLLHICSELDIEPEDVAKLVVGPLKDKLEAEAQNTNVLPKPNTLFGL